MLASALFAQTVLAQKSPAHGSAANQVPAITRAESAMDEQQWPKPRQYCVNW